MMMDNIADGYEKHIQIVIDQHLVDLYNRLYFVRHPRATKERIKSPIHPSLNTWSIMTRPRANALKQTWDDFIGFVLDYYKLKNVMLDDLAIKSTSYVANRHRHDCDGLTPKYILDSFVNHGFIVDDSYKYLHSITLTIDYDKNNPRTVLDIYYNGNLEETDIWKN